LVLKKEGGVARHMTIFYCMLLALSSIKKALLLFLYEAFLASFAPKRTCHHGGTFSDPILDSWVVDPD
jgi:hypothetical protein